MWLLHYTKLLIVWAAEAEAIWPVIHRLASCHANGIVRRWQYTCFPYFYVCMCVFVFVHFVSACVAAFVENKDEHYNVGVVLTAPSLASTQIYATDSYNDLQQLKISRTVCFLLLLNTSRGLNVFYRLLHVSEYKIA